VVGRAGFEPATRGLKPGVIRATPAKEEKEMASKKKGNTGFRGGAALTREDAVSKSFTKDLPTKEIGGKSPLSGKVKVKER
jgi:hypothetical protein